MIKRISSAKNGFNRVQQKLVSTSKKIGIFFFFFLQNSVMVNLSTIVKEVVLKEEIVIKEVKIKEMQASVIKEVTITEEITIKEVASSAILSQK